jgi:hypothetical protein
MQESKEQKQKPLKQNIIDTWAAGERFDAWKVERTLSNVRPGETVRATFPCNRAEELPSISADDLRELILNTKILGQRYLRGVRITGRLILEGARLDGDQPLPPLKFVQCYFDNGICLQDAKLAGLSLRGCRLTLDRDNAKGDYHNNLVHINGKNAEILGDLDLSHLNPVADHRPAPDQEKDPDRHKDFTKFETFAGDNSTGQDCTLMANFDGAIVRGSVEAAFSIFAEHWKYIQTGPHGSLPYCFSMVGTRIGGELRLSPWFECHGGLQLKEMHCQGEAWLTRSFISAYYLGNENERAGELSSLNRHLALFAQYATFCKNFSISQAHNEGIYDRRSTIEGGLDLLSCKAGIINLEGIHVLEERESKPPLIEENSLSLVHVNCKRLTISDRYTSEIQSRGIPQSGKVPCNIDISNACLESLVIEITLNKKNYIEAIALNVSKSAIIEINANTIDLSGFSRIGGDLQISGKVWNILLSDISIDGDFNARGWIPHTMYKGFPVTEPSAKKAWLKKNNHRPKLNLHNAQIKRSLKSPRASDITNKAGQYEDEDATRLAALVDLSDASCRVLDDFSGRGWKDGTHLKTDRFAFKSIARNEKNENKEKKTPKRRLRISKLIAERDYIFPYYNTDKPKIRYEKICYANNPGMLFSEQRLLWLMRYVQNLNIEFPEPASCSWRNFCKKHRRPASKIGARIDGGVFRQISAVYWDLGLSNQANYMEQARYRIDMKEMRRDYRKRSFKLKHAFKWFLLFLFGFYVSISTACGLNEECKINFSLLSSYKEFTTNFSTEFWMWSVFSLSLSITALLWNFLPIKLPIKALSIFGLWVFDTSYRVMFGYGLSLLRPFITIFILFTVGWWGASYIGENGLLTAESTIIAPYVTIIPDEESLGQEKPQSRALAPRYDTFVSFYDDKKLETAITTLKSTSDVSCKALIDYATYALDTFIPLIDLDQEDRCLIRPFTKGIDTRYRDIISKNPKNKRWSTFINHPTTWRVFQTIYVLLGWIVISLTIVIYSGALRRRNHHVE